LVQRRDGSGTDLGLQALDEQTWLVQRGAARTEVHPIGDGSWFVQAPQAGRLQLEPIGRTGLNTHLLVDRRTVRTKMHALQGALGRFLGDEHISWILRELAIDCVLDVGANIGQYGRRLRDGGYQGRIVSFEPLPHAAERLRETAASDHDWLVMECALGDSEGTAEMTVVEGTGTTSSLLEASEFGKKWSSQLEGIGRQQVPIRRLDQVFDEATSGLGSPRIYLKLDTQGYDLQAFAGAGERIGDVIGMQSEVSNVPIYEGMPRLPEQITTYEAAGFEITGMFPVTRDRETLRVIEFDAVMVRPDARSSATASSD